MEIQSTGKLEVRFPNTEMGQPYILSPLLVLVFFVGQNLQSNRFRILVAHLDRIIGVESHALQSPDCYEWRQLVKNIRLKVGLYGPRRDKVFSKID